MESIGLINLNILPPYCAFEINSAKAIKTRVDVKAMNFSAACLQKNHPVVYGQNFVSPFKVFSYPGKNALQ